MILIVMVFLLVLALTFAAILLMTRPTASERTLLQRVAHLQDAKKEQVKLTEEPPEILKQERLSKISWLDRSLQPLDLIQRLRLLIIQAESSWSVPGVLIGTLGMMMAGGAVGYYALPNGWAALAVGLVFAASPFLVLRFRRNRRLKAFNTHLPEAIELMSRALRAGHSLAASIEIVGAECPEPVRGEFREVYRQQNFGLPAREALTDLARRVPLPELNFVVTAMLLQMETGGNLVEILDRTSAVIRERLRIEGEIRIYTAQGRLTGWILSLLPVAMFFLLSLANRGYTRVLVEDPTGRKLVYTGLGLMVLGGLAIRKIVDVKV